VSRAASPGLLSRALAPPTRLSRPRSSPGESSLRSAAPGTVAIPTPPTRDGRRTHPPAPDRVLAAPRYDPFPRMLDPLTIATVPVSPGKGARAGRREEWAAVASFDAPRAVRPTPWRESHVVASPNPSAVAKMRHVRGMALLDFF